MNGIVRIEIVIDLIVQASSICNITQCGEGVELELDGMDNGSLKSLINSIYCQLGKDFITDHLEYLDDRNEKLMKIRQGIIDG
jgi:hypothetical protein